MNIKISAITDTGTERTNNEDSVIVCSSLENQLWEESEEKKYVPLGKYGVLLVVADGMGGASAGEVASSIAINTIKDFFTKERLSSEPITEDLAHKFLKESIKISNEAIIDHVITDLDSIGLGTTIVITWIIADKAYIAWCGDSRCYSYNQDCGIKRLTKDHSYVQELIDKGEISEKQAFYHPDCNIITKCLGDVDALSEPDCTSYSIKDGDILLSCTDGLCGYCDDKSIENVLLNNFEDLPLCRDNLLNLALKAGGHDNITIALCATLPDNQENPLVSISTKIKRVIKNIIG